MMEAVEIVKVLIVDDHRVVRQGLRTFLELNETIQVVGEAEDGQEAVTQAEKLLPDVILMDLVMPRLDGIAATSRIKALGLGTRVIALTSFAEDDKVFPAIQAGASSYLLKDVSPEALVEAIHATHRGESRLHPDVLRKLMKQVSAQPASAKGPDTSLLTERESDVIRLVAQGKSNREIAETLVISEKTVKSHITNILDKLHLVDRTQAAVYAWQSGIVRRE